MASDRPQWIKLILGAVKALVLLGSSAGLLLVPLGGRSTSSELLFAPYLPRTAHQAYGYSLALDGFSSARARAWLLDSERSVREPEPVELPLELEGRFADTAPGALGLAFFARGGRRVEIEVTAGGPAAGEASASSVFVDLFDGQTARPQLIESVLPARDTWAAPQRIELAVLEQGRYVLRVQPELDYEGEYRIRIRTAPLLAFPVEGSGTEAIQSGFGAERDGGARTHHGVDIFAPRGTPALAAMDSWVSRVETTPRGGNVVWLQPLFGDMRLYYAHLDSQAVDAGDFVLAGDVVGTVGNTGNAITTPPHLHFGVYLRRRGMRGGPRDPYPFLD